MVKEIKCAEEFDTLLKSAGDKLVVVDFTASWCGPCKRIAPVFEEMSDKYPNVLFYKVDVDDVPDLAERYGVKAMPTFQFFKCEQKLEFIRGADEVKLRETIERLK